MFALLVRRFFENVGDLDKSLFLRATGKVSIPVAGLGLAGKGCQKIAGGPAFSEFSHGFPLFNYFDGIGPAFRCRLPHDILKFFRDYVEFDHGQQLVLVVLEHFRAKLVAIAIAHALTGDFCLHECLLVKGKVSRMTCFTPPAASAASNTLPGLGAAAMD
jgi:hypothetical protein